MISIVIPIFEEEDNLPVLHERLTAASQDWNEDYEIVFVDDGSRDRSLAVMKELGRSDPHVRVVKLSRNFGHQPAISAGIYHARGDGVIVMDGDLQDPPEVLTQFIERWREGYQVVYAIRRKRKEALPKRLAYAAFYRILRWVSDIDIPLDSGDFCLMDRRVVDSMVDELPERIRFVRGLRAYLGFKQVGVEYERSERAGGEPKYTFGSLVKLAVSGVLGFSFLPLRLATYLGFLVAVPSFLVSFFFIVHRLVGFPVLGRYATETPGLASLASGLFFLCGVILIIMGILGEYIGRIYVEVKRRPGFIVDCVIPAEGREPEQG
jgi:glycosyltransferase involved in cell wall biosynthesis